MAKVRRNITTVEFRASFPQCRTDIDMEEGVSFLAGSKVVPHARHFA